MRASGVAHRAHLDRQRTRHRAARRAAGGQRGDRAARDRRPGDARDGGRGALRARRRHRAGRGQPRHADLPRRTAPPPTSSSTASATTCSTIRDLYNVERVEALKGPNAMIFGRGGVGGVINRVTAAGRLVDRRARLELAGRAPGTSGASPATSGSRSDDAAARVTGVYENSDSYRDGVGLRALRHQPDRSALRSEQRTTLRAGYEHFHDDRTADRGVSSFAGPARWPTDRVARSSATPTAAAPSVTVDALVGARHRARRARRPCATTLRYADYDKFYQNVFPGAVNAAGTHVALSAYNNGTERQNLFNQTDLVCRRAPGASATRSSLGAEVGRQVTDNLRLTGYFTGLRPHDVDHWCPLERPTTVAAHRRSARARPTPTTTASPRWPRSTPRTRSRSRGTCRRSPACATTASTVDFRNNRTGVASRRARTTCVSPRLGLVLKPAAAGVALRELHHVVPARAPASSSRR